MGETEGVLGEDLPPGRQAAVVLSLLRQEAEPEGCFMRLCKGITAWFPKEAKLCQQAVCACLSVCLSLASSES